MVTKPGMFLSMVIPFDSTNIIFFPLLITVFALDLFVRVQLFIYVCVYN